MKLKQFLGEAREEPKIKYNDAHFSVTEESYYQGSKYYYLQANEEGERAWTATAGEESFMAKYKGNFKRWIRDFIRKEIRSSDAHIQEFERQLEMWVKNYARAERVLADYGSLSEDEFDGLDIEGNPVGDNKELPTEGPIKYNDRNFKIEFEYGRYMLHGKGASGEERGWWARTREAPFNAKYKGNFKRLIVDFLKKEIRASQKHVEYFNDALDEWRGNKARAETLLPLYLRAE